MSILNLHDDLGQSFFWFSVSFFYVQVFYSRSTYQINSVMTLNPSGKYHGENYKQGFQFEEITKFMNSNLNMNLSENPLSTLLNPTLEFYRTRTPSKFGSMILDPTLFQLSAAARETFGKKFEPEILKFFNVCGTIMQTQIKWWRSGLLYGKLSESLLEYSKTLRNICPWLKKIFHHHIRWNWHQICK